MAIYLILPATLRNYTTVNIPMLRTGVNILQKEDFVWGIFRVLHGRFSTKFDNLKKNNQLRNAFWCLRMDILLFTHREWQFTVKNMIVF